MTYNNIKLHVVDDVKYIINNNKCNKSCVLFIIFKIGSVNEKSGIRGISHFVEHTIFKGSTKYRNAKIITDELYKLGTVVNAYTTYDETGFFIKCHPENLEKSVEIISNMISKPIFRPNDIEKERTVIISEYLESESNPFELCNKICNNIIFRGTAYQCDIIGTEKDIKKINAKDIRNFYKHNYVSPVISFVGNYGGNVFELLQHYFSRVNKIGHNSNDRICRYILPIQDNNTNNYNNTIMKNIQQNICVIGFRTYHRGHDDNHALHLLATILAGHMSSRLSIILREKKGLVYSVNATNNEYDGVGCFKISFSTFPDKKYIKECYKIICFELEKIKKNITQNELDLNRKYLLSSFSYVFENTSNIANMYGSWLSSTGLLFDRKIYQDKFNRVSLNDIMRVASNIFVENNKSIAVVSKINIPKL